MNQHLTKLVSIAQKSERWIIGLMSGTSVDGLDIALCRFSGSGMDTRIGLEHFETMQYPAVFKEQIASVFAKRVVDLEKVCLLNGWVALEHAKLILHCLQKWNVPKEKIDLIASHGQTIYHAPKLLHPDDGFGHGTLQIGDGDHLAVATGIITLSDFRQKHIAAGGEGAPLAVYGDFLIFSSTTENRIMLNIGGIANFTYLPSSRNPAAVFSTDIGTGNTLMDQYIQKHYAGTYYDADAAIAHRGSVQTALLHELKQHPFFEKSFPKTIGPELFNLAYLEAAIARTKQPPPSHEDTMATLNRFSADMIAAALQQNIHKEAPFTIYSSGGGMHNPLLMQHLKDQLPNIEFKNTAALGIHPDAKEAVLFAVLANETICGDTPAFTNPQTGIPGVSMGKVSFPA